MSKLTSDLLIASKAYKKLKNAISKLHPFLNIINHSYSHYLASANFKFFPEFCAFVRGNKDEFTTYGMTEAERVKSTLLYDSEKGILVDYYGNEANFSYRIYNMTKEGFLIVKPEKIDSRFNHSSICLTASIVCAGYISVNHGKITYINNSSGHYTPTSLNLFDTIRLISYYSPAIFTDDAVVDSIYEKSTNIHDFRARFDAKLDDESNITYASYLRQIKINKWRENSKKNNLVLRLEGEDLYSEIFLINPDEYKDHILLAKDVSFNIPIAHLPLLFQMEYSTSVGVVLSNLRSATIGSDDLLESIYYLYEHDQRKLNHIIEWMLRIGICLKTPLDAIIPDHYKINFIKNSMLKFGLEKFCKNNLDEIIFYYKNISIANQLLLENELVENGGEFCCKCLIEIARGETLITYSRIIRYFLNPINIHFLMSNLCTIIELKEYEIKELIFDFILSTSSENRLSSILKLTSTEMRFYPKAESFIVETDFTPKEIEVSSPFFNHIYIHGSDIIKKRIFEIVKSNPKAGFYNLVLIFSSDLKLLLSEHLLAYHYIDEHLSNLIASMPDEFIRVLSQKDDDTISEIRKFLVLRDHSSFEKILENTSIELLRFWEEGVIQNIDEFIEYRKSLNNKYYYKLLPERFSDFSEDLRILIYERVFESELDKLFDRIEINTETLSKDRALFFVFNRRITELDKICDLNARIKFINRVLQLVETGELDINRDMYEILNSTCQRLLHDLELIERAEDIITQEEIIVDARVRLNIDEILSDQSDHTEYFEYS